MAYFPNGDTMLCSQVAYCDVCVHWLDGNPCPVMQLHLWWNYDAAGTNADETKRTALNTLWPIAEDGMSNEACKMFVDAATVLPLGQK